MGSEVSAFITWLYYFGERQNTRVGVEHGDIKSYSPQDIQKTKRKTEEEPGPDLPSQDQLSVMSPPPSRPHLLHQLPMEPQLQGQAFSSQALGGIPDPNYSSKQRRNSSHLEFSFWKQNLKTAFWPMKKQTGKKGLCTGKASLKSTAGNSILWVWVTWEILEAV